MKDFIGYQAVVIGASAGGIAALSAIFTALPDDFPMPVIVAQHLHPNQEDEFIDAFTGHCPLPIKCADEKEAIKEGHVYFAPPNYHLLIEKDHTFSLSVDPRVKFARPSVDVLFESAADAFSSQLVGILLTGANDDGVMGVAAIKKHGGLTIVQDPATAEADYMPRAALAAIKVDHVLPVTEIGPFLARLIDKNPSTAK